MQYSPSPSTTRNICAIVTKVRDSPESRKGKDSLNSGGGTPDRVTDIFVLN